MAAIAAINEYIRQVFGEGARVVEVSEFGQPPEELKGFGYGKPYRITLSVGDTLKRVVLSSMRREGGFGHDHFSDRAQILLWQNATFGSLPRHVRSVDVGYFTPNGRMRSAGDAEEFFLLMDLVEGTEYFYDLDAIKNAGTLTERDIARAYALSDYLVDIHAIRDDNPTIYTRRIRDLVGHGELIMGLIDSYPDSFDALSKGDFCRLERRCVDWRYALKDRSHRLCMVHGDYHPWNIMFQEGTDFTLLDRSRGEFGEAADDVTSLSVNYLFYSIQEHGKLTKEFKVLYDAFFRNYLEKTQDSELLDVIQPFYAFRGLVVASPIWYPHITTEVRHRLFNFIRNVLETETFDYRNVNALLKD
ncbi:MAG: phosphotransferase [Euryarchaeota archaeon]|nr:phosphotransferase [Euryarchaeota archaeon]